LTIESASDSDQRHRQMVPNFTVADPEALTDRPIIQPVARRQQIDLALEQRQSRNRGE
jgi:hypothetical protein